MQRLIPINVGQQANDRSGDPLRDGMAKVNENFAKVTTAMDAVETAVAQTSALAGSARDIAALPAAQKNRPGGVAPLDADGKVPAGNLPDSVPMSQKGAAGGVAPLDAAGKAGRSSAGFHTLSQKGAVDGVTPLDASGKVPVAHLPKLDYLPVISVARPTAWRRWMRRARCRRPTCRRWRMPFRWRRRASPMASRRWPPTARCRRRSCR